MTITDYFKFLGAPLGNSRWSWGGVRGDGSVVLRVWQDRKMRIDGGTYMMLTHHQKYVEDQGNPGYRERLQHIERIRSGAKCYMVMCLANDKEATPREIQSFNDRQVFVGGDLKEADGDTWVLLADRIDRSKLGKQ